MNIPGSGLPDVPSFGTGVSGVVKFPASSKEEQFSVRGTLTVSKPQVDSVLAQVRSWVFLYDLKTIKLEVDNSPRRQSIIMIEVHGSAISLMKFQNTIQGFEA